MKAVGLAFGAGLLIALSVPPAGWWPLGLVGVALLMWLIRDEQWRRRALLGLVAGLGLYGLTIFWFAEFNAIGAVASMIVEASFMAAAAAVSRRPVAFPFALVLSDWLRTYIPFGGVPLGGIPLGQAAGPLAPAARIGGQLLITGVVAAVALVAAAPRRVGALGVLAAVLFTVWGRVAPGGHPVGTIRIAAVQGGGRRGLRAIHNSAAAVIQAQFAASHLITRPVDLILWPEDVISLGGPIAGSPIGSDVGAVAVAFHAALVAGVTEDVGAARFRNAMVVWDDTGRITGRYDKVHRVPFGEYIPGRSLIKHLVNLDVIPRDAIAGTGDGHVDTQAGPVGIVISFEVFFPARARSATARGQVLLAPTNTASYTTTQVPAAEIAADRLRAWETGRDVVMVAPTGWSAALDSRGRLRERTPIASAAVLQTTVTRRTGRTPYGRWGDWPVVILALGGLAALDWRPGRT